MILKGLPIVGTKLQLADLVFLIPLSAMFVGLWQRRGRVRLTPLISGWGLFLTCATLSTIGSIDLKVSLLELIAFGYMALLCLVVINTVTSWALWLQTIEVWVATSALVALLGIIGVVLGTAGMATPLAFHYPPLYELSVLKRPFWVASSTFWASPTPSMAYGYLHIGFFLSVGMLVKQSRIPARLWYAAALVIHTVGIVLTYSRGWVALLVGLCVFLWQFRSRVAVALSHVLFLSLVALTVLIQVISNYNITNVSVAIDEAAKTPEVAARYDYLLTGVPIQRLRVEATYAIFKRPLLHQAALTMFSERPFLGIGPGAFSNEVYRRQVEAGSHWGGLRVTTPWDPHSTYLGALAETGLLGFSSLMLILGTAVWQLICVLKRAAGQAYSPLLWALLSCLLGYLVFAFDEDLVTKRWVWMVIALGGSAFVIFHRHESG